MFAFVYHKKKQLRMINEYFEFQMLWTTWNNYLFSGSGSGQNFNIRLEINVSM